MNTNGTKVNGANGHRSQLLESEMQELRNKQVLVIGLGDRGRAACQLLRRSGAKVLAVDSDNTAALRDTAARLNPLGVEVALGISALPRREFSLAIVSPGGPSNTHLVEAVVQRQVPMIGELEFGVQQSKCLSIAISGTNGKGTTAELVERVLTTNHRKTVLSGDRAHPVCSVVEQTRHLDYLILQVDAAQLETTQFFRPAVAVLTNLAPDRLDRYSTGENYVRATSALLRNQQAFDWAIIQSEAMAQLCELHIPVPGKVITFSADDYTADIYLNRGLIISRLANWAGPLLDIDHCQLRGPHNAENLMAALAVGHVLRLSLDTMVDSLKTYSAGPHRFELVSEINGIQYINDAKASNLGALEKALLACRPSQDGQPNVLLIAGGKDACLNYHQLAPLLSTRVKRAILFGEAREKIRAAWALFTSCTLADSLLEAVKEATTSAASGDVVLFSPACSSQDPFEKYQRQGQEFCQAVKSISRGMCSGSPNIQSENTITE